MELLSLKNQHTSSIIQGQIFLILLNPQYLNAKLISIYGSVDLVFVPDLDKDSEIQLAKLNNIFPPKRPHVIDFSQF